MQSFLSEDECEAIVYCETLKEYAREWKGGLPLSKIERYPPRISIASSVTGARHAQLETAVIRGLENWEQELLRDGSNAEEIAQGSSGGAMPYLVKQRV